MALRAPTTLTRTDRIPPVPARMGLVVVAIAVLAYSALVFAALAGSGPWFVAAALLVAAAEVALTLAARLVPWALAQVELGLPWRWAVQSVLLVLLVAQVDRGAGTRGWVVLAVLTIGALGGVLNGLAEAVALLRKSPVLSWNLAVGDLRVPRPPSWLLRWRAACGLPAQVVLMVGAGAAVGYGRPGLLKAAVVVSLLVATFTGGVGAYRVLVTRRARPRERVRRAVQEAVTAYAPDVVLYYGGPPEALYQLEMWLPTLEGARHRPLVVMRDREAWRRLATTTLPVLCIPAGTTLVSFDLATVRAALFVANGTSNIHMLRMGGMRTAFIGHGDSDKRSSSNPFVRVYDEVWVAGPAGAQRYTTAGLSGVLGRIREVGRPHMSTAAPRSTPDDALTVVYAPTWEGWGDESHHSSLPHDGTAIVRTLLATPGVRVVYRPHPLTGTRDRAVRRAHEEVVAHLRAAGAPREVSAPGAAAAVHAGEDDLSAMLAAADAELPTALPDDARASWWRAFPPTTHRVTAGEWPGLASVLAQADLLVADVSGVVSDWLARDRPLALTNPAGLAIEDFRLRYPSSRAGLVLGAGGTGLGEFLAALRSGEDPTATARDAVRTHLLGEEPSSGKDRFGAALDAIVAEGGGWGSVIWQER